MRFCCALSGVFAVLGCLSIQLRTRYSVLLYALVIIGTAALVTKFKMVRLETSGDTEPEVRRDEK